MEPKTHWDRIYRTTRPDELSWFQATPHVSLDLIRRRVPDRQARIIDVGGGTSSLADALLASGYSDVTVLDVSAAALTTAKERLGARAGEVTWLDADVLTAALPQSDYDVWHDRAVFHFLTDPHDRDRYVAQVRRAVKPGGLVLVATFAEDGPTRCSGLPVARYSPQQLHRSFGADFLLLEDHREEHVTPSGVRQPFTYCACRFTPRADHRAA